MEAILIDAVPMSGGTRLYFRREDGKKVFVDKCYLPRFYVPAKPEERIDDYGIDGTPLKRVLCNHPSEVPLKRAEYERTYEAAIPYRYVCLIDEGIYCAVEWPHLEPLDYPTLLPFVLYFDIEVLSPPEVLPQPENPIWPIVTISWRYMGENHVWVLDPQKRGDKLKSMDELITRDLLHFSSEVKLLKAWFWLLHRLRPDIVTGWFTNHYDWPYIIKRAAQLGLQPRTYFPRMGVRFHHRDETRQRPYPRLPGIQVIDLLDWYRIITKPEGVKYTYDLKWIVEQEAGYKYEDWGDRIELIWKPSKLDVLIDYAMKDVFALELVDQARDITGEVFRRASVVGVLMEDVDSALKCILIYLHRVARKRGVRLPTIQAVSELQDYRGAFVARCKPGFYENVAVFDIRSMYPSIIVGMNLCPTTYDPETDTFKKDFVGILPEAVLTLMREREKLRAKRKQLKPGTLEYQRVWALEQSVKYHVNSFYGGFKHLFPAIPRTITAVGREITRALFDKFGAIYGDTDSIFVPCEWKDVPKKLEEVRAFLQEKCRELGFVVPLECSLDEYYVKLLLHTRKHYVGLTRDGRIVFKGVAFRRSDSAKVTIKVGRRFFEALMKEGVQAALQVLREVDLRKCRQDEIAIPKGIQKRLDQYKRPSAWVRGVMYSQQHLGLKFREDQRPLLLYVKGVRGKPPTDVICLPGPGYEVPEAIIDYDKMYDKVIRKKFEPFVNLLGYRWEEIFTGKLRQRRLEEWFSE